MAVLLSACPLLAHVYWLKDQEGVLNHQCGFKCVGMSYRLGQCRWDRVITDTPVPNRETLDRHVVVLGFEVQPPRQGIRYSRAPLATAYLAPKEVYQSQSTRAPGRAFDIEVSHPDTLTLSTAVLSLDVWKCLWLMRLELGFPPGCSGLPGPCLRWGVSFGSKSR